MGDIAGRFISDVTARLPSAALWSACSLTVTDFLHLRRVNWSVNCFKKAFRPSIVVLLDETFDSTRPQAHSVSELFCHTCGDPAARLVPFQPMAHGSTL